jgi:hypothetical protein
MKKLYIENKFKLYNKVRAENRNKRRLTHNYWKAQKNKELLGRNEKEIKERNRLKIKYIDFEHVVAPKIFSFIKNTNEVVKFIDSLKKQYDLKKKVFVVLEKVEQIDYSAIVVLLSIMVKFKVNNIDFNGNMPTNIESNKIVKESGFLDNLYKKFDDKESYEIPTIASNGIHTHASKKVDSVLSSNIITSAAKYIWGEPRRCQGVQRALIELMQNTNNHAEIDKTGEKHWWLSVHHNKKHKLVAFSFVDFGVGIFTNLQNKTSQSQLFGALEKLYSKFKYGDNSQLIKLILDGELHRTVTGKYYRGKGLPGIAEVMKRNQISNLHIITNNVFCCPSKNIYRILDKSFIKVDPIVQTNICLV